MAEACGEGMLQIHSQAFLKGQQALHPIARIHSITPVTVRRTRVAAGSTARASPPRGGPCSRGGYARTLRAVRASNLVQHHGRDKTQVVERALPINTGLCEYRRAPQQRLEASP